MPEDPPLLETPLAGLHRELGARMVPFAGYVMPVQYPGGIIAEHTHCRTQAALFDVSHMGQVRIVGPHAPAALERLTTGDLQGLGRGRMRYTLFTNEAGGILDDLMVTRRDDDLFVVVNAACKADDVAHMRRHLGEQAVTLLGDRALLALQGPAAAAVMARLAPGAETMAFMSMAAVAVADIACLVSRSGYTGEDGYEISVPAAEAEKLARRLLDEPEVGPAGLGARDSLRLEAGLCLYGHDIDTTTTPIEAGLAWAVSKSRRKGGAAEGGFPGAETVLGQLSEGTRRRRVGIRPEGRAPVREGAEIVDRGGRPVGRVTSGGFGPTVGGPVAMGYVETALAEPGTALAAMVRGEPRPVAVAKLPFVAPNYHRG